MTTRFLLPLLFCCIAALSTVCAQSLDFSAVEDIAPDAVRSEQVPVVEQPKAENVQETPKQKITFWRKFLNGLEMIRKIS